mgnify:FL=1
MRDAGPGPETPPETPPQTPPQTADTSRPDAASGEAEAYRRMFDAHDRERARRAAWAGRIADLVTSHVRPDSVVDLGCGLGFFLAAMGARGATHLRGVDADWIEGLTLEVARDVCVLHDLAQPYQEARRYDLAACLEVAEHLPPERGPGLVADLARLSDRVLFSAAVPGQGGRGHINCRWQSYWAGLFADAGYRVFDPYRRALAAEAEMAPWFQQNLLLFWREGLEIPPALAPFEIAPRAADMILPHYHSRVVANRERAFHAAREQLRAAGLTYRPPGPRGPGPSGG